jgi:oligopeptide/dipeptide ABC transporter ATP-binding protein
VCNPALLIADEPTTALDVTIQAQILDLLKELTRTEGLGLILITHNLGVVARYADRVNVMYAGRIVESGTAEEIFARPAHPYTIGLTASVPRLDAPREAEMEAIEGQAPDLSRLPPGCAFAPRCRWAEDACRAAPPPETEIAPGRRTACIRWQALAEPA